MSGTTNCSVITPADRVGRDYTTFIRQLDRLAHLGLIERRAGSADRRVREAVISPSGKAMNDAIDGARERLMLPPLPTSRAKTSIRSPP